ncbi:MAG: low molecular weight phosphotyrosine protein phosphatase [Acidimicrobiia bacterium]|nr:low molecular weight phosphotyrosine protein phosphatase [Acidimicrobiia bacterium]
MTTRILTVCLGNICRSPTAEAAIREAAGEMDVDVDVDSAGTGNWHVGGPSDPRMRRAAAKKGLTIESVARQVSADDFRSFDLIVAMDRRNLEDLEALAPADGTAEVRLFRDYDPSGPGEVPDPYYGGEAGFALVVDMCRRTARQLVAGLD